MKIYPSGQITPYGAKLLKDRIDPLIIYTSPDNGLQWYINGGLAPQLGVQEGAALADGVAGLHPPFSALEHKGARQDGVTHQRTVYDPAEYDMDIEFSAVPNRSNPEQSAAQMRKVIRDWIASWDPEKPGTLSWITPDMGRWWCEPRLFRSPPDKQFRAQARRLRQRYKWTIRNDNAFWRGVDSVCTFPKVVNTLQIQSAFTQNHPGNIGPEWVQTYSGAGAGVLEARDGAAVWAPSGTGERTVVNTLQGVNERQTVAFADGVPTGGVFTLEHEGNETLDITHTASPTTVQTRLEALPSIGAGNVSVTGEPGAYTVEFRNALGLQPIDPLVPRSSLTGSAPTVTVASATPGLGSLGSVAPTAVTITTGNDYQAPPAAGQPGNPGMGAPPDAATPTVSLFGWFDSGKTTGVSAILSAGTVILSKIIGGVTSVIKTAVNIVGTIAKAAITLVTEVIQIAVGVVQTVVSVVVNGIKIVAGIIGSLIGAFFNLIGFGAHTGANTGGQLPPPPVTGVGVGGVPVTQSGELSLTNFGDQDGYPRYLVYGPGTFKIANGPNSSEMIEFGPLLAGQIALLTTLPRLRGVVDLTPDQPSQAVTPEFDDFLSQLISLVTNNNAGPLLQWFQSLFGILPPQGYLYALLKGRFTNPIPPKPAGSPPVVSKIQVQIINGGPGSKIVGALTPLRRWPE